MMDAVRHRLRSTAVTLGMLLCVSTVARSAPEAVTVDANPFVGVYAAVAPSVVRIVAGNHYASGLIVSTDGLVVTHSDVASSNELDVYLPDQAKVRARLLLRNSRLALAVLQLLPRESPGADNSDDDSAAGEGMATAAPGPAVAADSVWPAVRLGAGLESEPGHWVATVAYPLGSDEKRLTSPAMGTGLLSARGRFPTRLRYRDELLLTDAAVNSGSEGGALVDRRGRVIGILTRPQHHRQTNTALNLALPIEVIAPLLEQARTNPDPPRDDSRQPAFLGIISDEVTELCQILDVVEGGPAQKSGLKAGDLVVEADGRKLDSFDDLLDVLDQKRSGDSLRLVVHRKEGDKQVRKEFEVTLGERPASP